MKQYEIGTSPRLLVEFTDEDGDAYDPTTIALKVKEPDGTVTTKAIGDLSNPEVGTWYYVFAITQEGLHAFRFTGRGPDYDISALGYFKGTDVIGS